MSTEQRAAEVEAVVTGFLTEKVLQGDARGLTRTTPLLEAGIINSLNIVTLVAALEERFGIKVRGDALIPDNIGSVEAIGRWISRLPPPGAS